MNDEAARARHVGSKVCNVRREYFARERGREGEYSFYNMHSLLKPEFPRLIVFPELPYL